MYSGRYKSRYVGRPNKVGKKAKRGRGTFVQVGEGSGRHLVPALRPPTISRFERMLDRYGMPVQRFRQFRTEERVNVTPKSGYCYWYGVPEMMEFGNAMNLVDHSLSTVDDPLKYIMKQTPNTCDLFDIYRNLSAGVSSNTTDYGPDTRGQLAIIEGHRPAIAFGFAPYGVQSTRVTSSGTELYKQVPTAYRISKPGMDYTMRTQITYDNVSSLDAFVEVYCLEYRRPASSHGDSEGNSVGATRTVAELCDNNAFAKKPLHWKYNQQHPGVEFCSTPSGADTALGMTKYQGPRFAGGMLRCYAQACLYQRVPAYTGRLATGDEVLPTVDMGIAAENSAPNGLGIGAVSNPEVPTQIVCNPKVDPLRTTPPGRSPAELGYRMFRIKSAQRIKPGNSCKFAIPTSGTKHWSYLNSPVGAMEATQKVQFTGAGDEYAVVERTRIYFFRVWGDMIHAKVDRTDGFETDFQTGSTSVTFHTQRVCWARLKTRYNTTVNPQLLQFEADDIALGSQEFINPETGAPMVLENVGDSV